MNRMIVAFAFTAAMISSAAASPAFIQQLSPNLLANTADLSVTLDNMIQPVQHMQETFSAFRETAKATGGTLTLIQQDGEGHLASANQQGFQNIGVIMQTGGFNSASLVQTGNRNTGLIVQQGYFNSASISQTGNNHNAMIMQQGRGNVAIISQR